MQLSFYFAVNLVIPRRPPSHPHSVALRAPFVLPLALMGHIGSGIKEIWCDSAFEELDMLIVTLTDLSPDLGRGVREGVF